jgi:hypothetical protein
LCYPNLQATSPHKLAPRSTACVFLGYPSAHKGYRCLHLSTRRIIISRHIIFDEFVFPFAKESLAPTSTFDFLLDDEMDIVPCSTNPAAAPSGGDAPAPVAALSSSDVEQPLHLHIPGGCGSVPPSGSSTPGGRGFVPPSRSPSPLSSPGERGSAPSPVHATGSVAPQLKQLYQRLHLLPSTCRVGLTRLLHHLARLLHHLLLSRPLRQHL